MAELVHLEKRGAVAVLTIDNPPVNPVGPEVCIALAERLDEVAKDTSVKAAVLTGAGRAFVAGADIRRFGKPRPAEAPSLRDVVARFEDCSKPVVAAINGACAGGGLELALGCRIRLAGPAARIGLPEVKLGLIPGAGGTQRLTRLIGAEAALGVIVEGELMPAERAKELGIVEDVVAGDLVAAAVARAERAAAGDAPAPVSRREDKVAADRARLALFDDYRKGMARRYRGFEAPFASVDAVEAAVTLDFEDGMKKEREIFDKCENSVQSKAQRYLFFAEREVAKIPDVPRDTPVKRIETAAVVGAGTMGGGIAMCFANVGIPVTIIEAAQDALDRGLARVRQNYDISARRGRFTPEQVEDRMGLITGSLRLEDAAAADIVIEAVYEDLDLKKDVFRRLDAIMKEGAVLATNTSGLDIDAIAAETRRPEAVIGTHFFSPANVMRLLETVRGAKTGKETIATAMDLGRRIGKVPVLVGLCPGFVGNRILRVYLTQADRLLLEGALPQEIDKAIYDFGFAMGPYAMRDMAGLDIGYQARKAQGGSNDPRFLLNDRLCDLGRRGQKTGAGYYRYESGDRTPIPDPEVAKLIEGVSKDLGIARRPIAADEILESILCPMVNEGAKIVEEGIALRASDIDVVYIHGYGFPRYRGGPMFHGDTLGPDKVLEVMQRLHRERGEGLSPAPLLERLAREGGSFTGT